MKRTIFSMQLKLDMGFMIFFIVPGSIALTSLEALGISVKQAKNELSLYRSTCIASGLCIKMGYSVRIHFQTIKNVLPSWRVRMKFSLRWSMVE